MSIRSLDEILKNVRSPKRHFEIILEDDADERMVTHEESAANERALSDHEIYRQDLTET